MQKANSHPLTQAVAGALSKKEYMERFAATAWTFQKRFHTSKGEYPLYQWDGQQVEGIFFDEARNVYVDVLKGRGGEEGGGGAVSGVGSSAGPNKVGVDKKSFGGRGDVSMGAEQAVQAVQQEGSSGGHAVASAGSVSPRGESSPGVVEYDPGELVPEMELQEMDLPENPFAGAVEVGEEVEKPASLEVEKPGFVMGAFSKAAGVRSRPY